MTVGDSGGPVLHDWNFIFSRLGLLSGCHVASWLTRQAGNLSMLACLAGGTWLLWQMAQKIPPPEPLEQPKRTPRPRKF